MTRKPFPPRSIRLESVPGRANSLDVIVEAPPIRPPASESEATYLPTLWNVSYGFQREREKTAVHRISFKQSTTAAFYIGHAGASNLTERLTAENSAPGSKTVKSFQAAIEHATNVLERSMCSNTWECPATVNSHVEPSPCRMIVEGELSDIIIQTPQSHQAVAYRLVSWFSTGKIEGNRSHVRKWQLRYSASLLYGAIVRLNERIISVIPGPLWHTSAVVIDEKDFNPVDGWNKLEILGADTCCRDSSFTIRRGHSIDVRSSINPFSTHWKVVARAEVHTVINPMRVFTDQGDLEGYTLTLNACKEKCMDFWDCHVIVYFGGANNDENKICKLFGRRVLQEVDGSEWIQTSQGFTVYKKPESWTPWRAWSDESLPAVSGFMPPVNGPQWSRPSIRFRIGFMGHVTRSIPVDAEPSTLRKYLMELDSVGLVEVSRTGDNNTHDFCDRTGWCSWDITFLTNVLFDTPISQTVISVRSDLEDHHSANMGSNVDASVWPCDHKWVSKYLGPVEVKQPPPLSSSGLPSTPCTAKSPCSRCESGCEPGKHYQCKTDLLCNEKFKIALGLCQVFSSFKATYEIKWPPEVIEWFNQFAIFENLDILKLVAMDCLFKTDYLFSLKFITLSPLVLVAICYLIWLKGKVVYAHRLALYPRVCTKCHQPIDMFEKSPYHRAVLLYISKQSFCARMKLRFLLFWNLKRNRGVLHVPIEKLREVGIMSPPHRYDCDKPEPHESCAKVGKKQCMKLLSKALCVSRCRKNKKTKIQPAKASRHRHVHKSLTTREMELKASGKFKTNSSTPASSAWENDNSKGSDVKQGRRKLRRKTSLENNFGKYNHSQVHRFDCKDESHIDYVENHKEIPLFNFRMRVLTRMQFRNFKSRCLKLLFWILLIVYPSVSRKILMLYKCIDIGERSYMMWDTQVQCYTETWYAHSFYALVFGVIYILGVPGLFFGLLYQSRFYDIDAKWHSIKSSPTRLVKTLKLAREDYWSKGRHWSQILNAKEEERRVRWYLANLNMRSPKTMMRIGFMYKSFLEDFWAFELFEFFFKLAMTGVMVHIRPGTVTQIIAGLTMCFVAFTMHLAFQPYKDVSNNILMGAGKMQLFLTLLLALLLKMEAPFFSGNDQMDEADLSSLASIIIGTSAALVVAWVLSILYDIIMAKKKKKAAKKLADERRDRRQRFKRTTKLLKAATMKNKIFAGQVSKEKTVYGRRQGKMERKRTMAKQREAEKIMKVSHDRMVQSNTLQAIGFSGSDQKRSSNTFFQAKKLKGRSISKQKEEANGTNHFDSKLKQQIGTTLLSEVRKDFGAGSQVYVNILSTVQEIRSGKLTSSEAARMAEATLNACEPRVPPKKIQEYCELIAGIKIVKDKEGLSSEAAAFIPSSTGANSIPSSEVAAFIPKD